MTFEFKKLIQAYLNANQIGVQSVMATVVALKGSSYRRPGVRMLLTSNGQMFGAVSGGCVEKEVLKQAESVFRSGIPKIMTYDGRYRLGCEGLLYILIEPFRPDKEFIIAFEESLEERETFEIRSCFEKEVGSDYKLGSVAVFKDGNSHPFLHSYQKDQVSIDELEVFVEKMDPCFKLILIGAEHDTVALTKFASLLGWDVVVVASMSDPQTLGSFPGAYELLKIEPESLDLSDINKQTAIVLMTHSYVKDLKFLNRLKDSKPLYLGLLGPSKRRERLLNEFIETNPMVEETFFDVIYGPTGLNIGAETPQEISLSICSEILAVKNNQSPESLKDKKGSIHCDFEK